MALNPHMKATPYVGLFTLLSVASACLVLGAQPAFAGQQKVLIIGIDGCRPDALEAAVTPYLDGLRAEGLYSNQSQAVYPTSSGPNWSSMLTAVSPAKHGVTDNSFNGDHFDQYPHFFTRVREVAPSLFLASFVHWTPIHTEIVTDADVSVGGIPDAQVAQEAAQLLLTGDPDVIFLHFDDVDGAGHSFGYSPDVPEYLDAIEITDTHIGTVLDALMQRLPYTSRATGPAEDWLILVSTDHGGIGTGHGGNSPEELTIFLIASSPSVYDGETIMPSPVIMDTIPTAMDHLGLPVLPAWDWDGESVLHRVGCPDGLLARAKQENGTVALVWQAATGPQITGYELLRNGRTLAFLPPTRTDYLDAPNLNGLGGHAVFDYELVPLATSEGCPTLRARAVLSTGDVRLWDDFESHASDAELEGAGWMIVDTNNPIEDSTWTITNPGGRANPPTFDGIASGGRFLISDSDWGGSPSQGNQLGSGMSHDLLSPNFDCTGLGQVWLHASCSAVLNDNGQGVLDVDVSINGGSWLNAFRRVAPARSATPFPDNSNADGFFGRLDVDLSPFATGQRNVRVRVRHYEPRWDWWVALDDFMIDDVDLTSGGSSILLGLEDFSGGIPVTWTLSGQNTGTETWHTSDKGGRYSPGNVSGQGVNRLQHPGSAPAFAILDSDANPDPAEDELLMTPAIDCGGVSRVFLHYSSEVLPDASATEEVLLSLDGGITFEPQPLFSYAAGGLIVSAQEPHFARRVIEVPLAAGAPNVVFAFRYASPGDRGWWAVDDVFVIGE